MALVPELRGASQWPCGCNNAVYLKHYESKYHACRGQCQTGSLLLVVNSSIHTPVMQYTINMHALVCLYSLKAGHAWLLYAERCASDSYSLVLSYFPCRRRSLIVQNCGIISFHCMLISG